jgi:K+-transporting ATPase KdpF subunit
VENIVYWIGGAVAAILFVYLLLALVKPEWFA